MVMKQKARRKRGPREKYVDKLPIKVCKFDIRIVESGVLLDRSCTGATPRPCGTFSVTHHKVAHFNKN